MESAQSRKTSMRGVSFAQERSRETLRRILNAAEEVFSKKGYHKTTVADIISRAGIGHGTFWLYFRNKDDLLRYMLQDMINEFESFAWYRENNLENITINSVADVENILRDVMQVFLRYSRIHPLIVRASLESEEFRRTLDELNQPFAHIVETKLREHLEKGLCRDLDPEVTARIILTMLEFTNLQWLNRSLSCDRDVLVHNLSVIIYHTMKHA